MRSLFALLLLSSSFAGASPVVRVVTFSGILAEVAQRIGGENVEVSSLLPAGLDPHEYQPTPSDLTQLREARLVLVPGANLIPALRDIRGMVDPEAKVLVFDPVGDSAAEAADPHWWHSVTQVESASRQIGEALSEVAPQSRDDFFLHLKTCLGDLGELKRWIKRKVAELPRDKRMLVTSHDAFQYFAREFGFTIYAIEGVDPDAEPSSRHVAELIDTIKARGVRSIFLESTLNPKVIREITRETGATIGGTLYADGLGPGDASTYAGMMRHNVTTIVDALK